MRREVGQAIDDEFGLRRKGIFEIFGQDFTKPIKPRTGSRKSWATAGKGLQFRDGGLELRGSFLNGFFEEMGMAAERFPGALELAVGVFAVQGNSETLGTVVRRMASSEAMDSRVAVVKQSKTEVPIFREEREDNGGRDTSLPQKV